MNIGATIDRLDRWQRRHPIPAFGVAVLRKGGDDQVAALSGLVAYFAFFAVFPLLLVLVTLAGWALADHPDLRERVLDSAIAQFPVVGDDLRSNVGHLDSSGVALVVGLVAALWAGLGLGRGLQRASDVVWGVPVEERALLVAGRLRALAVVTIVGITLVVTSATAAVIAGAGPATALTSIAAALLSVAIVAVAMLGLFRVLTPDQPWSRLWPGALVATVGWIVLQALGAWFVARVVQRASDTYGVFAVVIGLLVWLSLLARLLVMASEVNVVRARHLWPRELLPPRRSRG